MENKPKLMSMAGTDVRSLMKEVAHGDKATSIDSIGNTELLIRLAPDKQASE
jgi:RNA-binding protein YhbY